MKPKLSLDLRLYRKAVMLTKHEIYHVHNCKNANNCRHLTLMIIINKTSESLKERKVFIFQHSSLNEQVKLRNIYCSNNEHLWRLSHTLV